MKRAYLVVEGQSDAEVLKNLLPHHVLQDVDLVVASGRYSAQSLARSLLATKQLPVALIIDADTTDQRLIQEQEDFYREALREASSGTKFDVFFVQPGATKEASFINRLSKFLSTQSSGVRR